MRGPQPSSRSVLEALPKARIVELGRDYEIALSVDATRETQTASLVASGRVHFRELLSHLTRDELRAACRAHGIDDSGRARPALQARLLEAHGALDSAPPPPLFRAHEIPDYAPRVGKIVACRHRQWLVEDVAAPTRDNEATRVRLVCLDDDAQGRVLEVLWELELGARVLQPETRLGDFSRIDPPRWFGAYLHALKWSAVTATDANLLQAPFRAGIKLLDYQLTPLIKALALPRANLFIADDVGLGKTIEAGLVLEELLLRQRIELVVIVCPASVTLQWRDEMEKRFGLHFEVMSRAFIARRRKERGFGVNPWATHNRFIISHPLLRRPDYRDPLLQHIGERAKKSLLILDEAHIAAPATSSRYAIDSSITRVIRDIAPRFENRLFLSATPHNGHSNSFSALLEILDPQRFTRGVKIRTVEELEPVMVRRLKEDLRKLGRGSFPLRKLVQIDLAHTATANASTNAPTNEWTAQHFAHDPSTQTESTGELLPIGASKPIELELADLLAEYTSLMKPTKGRGKLVFINLQKRLLSSVDAFARTLHVHARSVASGKAAVQLDLAAALPTSSATDATNATNATDATDTSTTDDDLAADDAQGPDDEAIAAEEDRHNAAASAALTSPEGRARELLDAMLRLADQHRGAADAKALALVDWVRRHQCPAARIGGPADNAPKTSKRDREWSDTRVLIFTEYGDTKRYLHQVLSQAVAGTDRDDARIMHFHGGMSDDHREEVQRAFNSAPDAHPVRILIATDAAREGVNLQGHCADLFHFDVPWNPARMEQRNGRIDRTLQSAPEVRCHYFIYKDRDTDIVLQKLVSKVDVIHRELGSLGAVLMEHIEHTLDDGIETRARTTETALDAIDPLKALRDAKALQEELESQRKDLDKMNAEIERAAKILHDSTKVLDFKRPLLRDAIDVGLELAGAGPLRPATPADTNDDTATPAWLVPDLPDSWQRTLDTLRPPRARDESFWDWRKKPPQPVLFEPPPRMNSALVQLHLSHPFVKRILGRFLAQGYSAHDLGRVTIVKNKHDSLVRVLAFGRLSLFGRGAARLHDQLVSVAARWIEGRESELTPFSEEADRNALRLLEQILSESPTLEGISPTVQSRVQAAAPTLFNKFWETIRHEADARATEAKQQLERRGRTESDQLRDILATQRAAIIAEIERRADPQQALALDLDAREREQRAQESRHLDDRLVSIQREIESEPPQIQSFYDVALVRLEPVGLVVLWPETRG